MCEPPVLRFQVVSANGYFVVDHHPVHRFSTTRLVARGLFLTLETCCL